MDKQKQMIEEIRKVIKHYAINQHCNKENIYKSHLITSDSKGIANALYNAGYGKLPENAVVLTREEYEKLKSLSTIEEITLGAVYDNTRKETAEKFAERLKSEMQERDYMGVKYKQGVFTDSDIDEICKEITDKGVQNGD